MTAGGFLPALSQLVPFLQVFAGSIALAIINVPFGPYQTEALLVAQDSVPVDFFANLLVTLITGTILAIVAMLIGLPLQILFRGASGRST